MRRRTKNTNILDSESWLIFSSIPGSNRDMTSLSLTPPKRLSPSPIIPSLLVGRDNYQAQRREHDLGTNTGSGTGEVEEAQSGGGAAIGDDALVDIAAIRERFERAARARLKAKTLSNYSKKFQSFATEMGLDKMNRRRMTGKPGKALILGYLERHPRPSWRFLLAQLKTVWAFGVGLPWPIDSKVDIAASSPGSSARRARRTMWFESGPRR
jgi:hypothetical protein